MEEKSNVFLETEPVGRLMGRYAVPCVISLLVAALYNVVDQVFIANASYLGSFGNAANTVVFPHDSDCFGDCGNDRGRLLRLCEPESGRRTG